MKILILGAGKMGSFFTDVLSFEHEVAVFETDPKRLRFMYNCYRFTKEEEIEAFRPELVINAVTVKYTLQAFNQVMPFLPKDCIISDIASVKTDLAQGLHHQRYRFGQDRPAGVLRAMRIPLCIYPSDVRTDLCQLRPTEFGERHHHQGRRPSGQDIL